MEQDQNKKTLRDYLQNALATSRDPREYLTADNLEGFKQLILKGLEDISFLSKYDVGYRVQDIYFSEGKLRMQGILGLARRKDLKGYAPMSLPMHLNDPEYTPVPINWNNNLSIPLDLMSEGKTFF